MNFNENKIYYTQIFFSFITLSFCIGMIAKDPSTQTSSIYLPILTSIVGVWLPQPKNNNSNQITPSISDPLENV